MKPYYQDSSVTIYCGDCREILPSLGKFDLLLTDPPYGIGASSGTGKSGRRKWEKGNKMWDESPAEDSTLLTAKLICSYGVIFGMNYFSLPVTENYLVWDKGEGFKGRSFAECELAWVSWPGHAKIYKRDPIARGDYKGKLHPTQKPEELMRWIIREASFHPDRIIATILDPYAGSGTTGRAAKDLGFKATLIEREEEYCEIAAKRMAQEVLDL